VNGASCLRARLRLVFLLAACAGAMLTAGCGGGGADARPAVIDAYGAAVHRDSLAPELRLFIWPDYMDRELVQEFERTYGVSVVIDYYDNNEALIAKLTAGGLGQYDVIVASDYAVEVLQREQRLLPLEHAHIPNVVNLEPRFRALPFDSGNRYTVTYQWGTTGLGIRTDLANTSGVELNTWKLVFDSAAQGGPFVMLSDVRETIAAALLYLGHSANTTDSVELAAAEQLLLRQRPRLLTYAASAHGRDLLASGDVVVAHNYSGDILMAQQEVEAIRYVIPREGAILWTDNLAVPARAPSKYTAEVFINFILDAQVGGRLSNFTRYASPNAAAWPHIADELKTNPAVYPDSTVSRRLEVLRDVGAARAQYDRIWSRLRAGR
jgi:spermidine/putrescine transport system substrate-binding protein